MLKNGEKCICTVFLNLTSIKGHIIFFYAKYLFSHGIMLKNILTFSSRLFFLLSINDAEARWHKRPALLNLNIIKTFLYKFNLKNLKAL